MTKKTTLLIATFALMILVTAAGATVHNGQRESSAPTTEPAVAATNPLPYFSEEPRMFNAFAAAVQDNDEEADEPATEPERENQETPAPRVVADRSGRVSAQARPVEPQQPVSEPASEPAPPAQATPAAEPVPAPAERAVTYSDYTVSRGDTLWAIAVKQGVPMPELLKTNNLTERSALSPGMVLKIPRYHIPVKATPGPEFGELLDWWSEAQYVWPIGKDARVIDFHTGKSFMARRTIGAFHADVEPLTAEDSRIMREIWGNWSWSTRPVIVEVDGRRLAASANGMPHSIQTIPNNNFNGHFCIHFLNSTRHKDNLVQSDHQQNIRTAAGQ